MLSSVSGDAERAVCHFCSDICVPLWFSLWPSPQGAKGEGLVGTTAFVREKKDFSEVSVCGSLARPVSYHASIPKYQQSSMTSRINHTSDVEVNIFVLYTYKKNDKRYTKITSRFALKQKCIVSVSIESFTKVNDLSHSPSEHNQ